MRAVRVTQHCFKNITAPAAERFTPPTASKLVMRYLVLASDYDGTMASQGRVWFRGTGQPSFVVDLCAPKTERRRHLRK
jgi:hypothetical protein